jgi:Ca2+-binding EF-hand superfamily protein
MKMAILAVVSMALLGLSFASVADDSMMSHDHMMTMMKEMDTNGDGKISKEEFMAYHEKMWMKMKKDSNGMVDAKSMMMQMMHNGTMSDKNMSKDSMAH